MKKDKTVVVQQEPRTRLTPVDVQQQQFRRSFRGYDEQEVDDFLDRVTEDVGALLEENGRLKEQAGSAPTTPVEGAADAAEASRTVADLKRRAQEQADAIVRDAEARAAAMLRDAEVRASSGGAATAAGEGDASGHLSRFVTRERSFLQDLASLIQLHAEGVKEMVQEARSTPSPTPTTVEEPQAEEARPRQEPAPREPTEAPSFPAAPTFAPRPTAGVAASRAQEPFGPGGVSAGRDIDETADAEMAMAGTAEAEQDMTTEQDPPVIQVPDADAPSTVTIREPAAVQRDEDERAPGERRDRDRERDRERDRDSLSELFWGED